MAVQVIYKKWSNVNSLLIGQKMYDLITYSGQTLRKLTVEDTMTEATILSGHPSHHVSACTWD